MATVLALPASGYPAAMARARIRLTHVWRHGRLPALDTPRTFNELVQHRKLHDRDPTMAAFADKVRAKTLVTDRLGPGWVIPTLWHGVTLPPQQWPGPLVVKARHACNRTIFVVPGGDDWAVAARKAERWMRSDYGFWLDEWLYGLIPRGLLIEPFVGTAPLLPIDYKLFVFGGRVEFIQVHLGRATRHRWIVFDRAWRRVSAATQDADPPAPITLPRMIEAAETLGRSFDFVRVDMYEVGGRPLFGEMTFYPGSGLDRFNPVALDETMGERWRAARER